MNTAALKIDKDSVLIAFKHFVKSDRNIRKTSSSKEEDKKLYASIKAKGLLQNLSVTQSENGTYPVEVGGRRLEQLTKLVSEGHFSPDDLFPCKIVDEAEAEEISLHENHGRVATHPADEFMAYKELTEQNKSPKEIALAFGVSVTYVKKMLKLSCLAPKLIGLFRERKLEINEIMAFTVSDDHEKQLACYTELSPHSLYPNRIRNTLLGEALETTDRLVQLVGLSAYKKAGGTTTSDMFENTVYVNQSETIKDLATDKLKAQCVILLADGWSWADYTLSQTYFDYSITTLDPVYMSVPKKLEKQISTLTAEFEALENIDNPTETDEKRYEEIESELDKLEEKRKSYQGFKDEQKKVSGVTVYCNDSGELSLQYGCVRKEDLAKAFPNTDKSKSSESKKDNNRIESKALQNNIKNYRIQAIQSQIAVKPTLANDLLIFTLAINLLSKKYDRVLLNTIESSTTSFSETKDIAETQANEKLRQNRTDLPLSWMNAKSQAKKFEKFQALSNRDKQKVMAHCVGISFSGLTYGDNSLQKVIEQQLDFNFSDLWKPSADNYYSKLQRKDLLTLGNKVIGKKWRELNESAKKAGLVDIISKHEKFTNWMPKNT